MVSVSAALKAFAILPKVGGSFSIVGSCLVLRDVGRKWQKVPLTTEVVAHITVANLFIAFWECFLSTWMVPKDSPAFMATGNTVTCNVQGFISVGMFIILESSYAILSVLYWIMVAYGWTERKTQRRQIRFFFLGLPVVIGIGFATPPLFYQMYNFSGAYTCLLEEYPLNCDIDPDLVCTRGATARNWQAGLFIAVLACLVVIIVSMCLLVKNVRSQEKKSDRYLTKGQKKRRAMTRRTFWQAIRYFLVFFISNLPFFIYAVYDIALVYAPVSITFIYTIVWPMFGVFNSFGRFFLLVFLQLLLW